MGTLFLGILRNRQTYIVIVFILCIGFNLYFVSLKTTPWKKRQLDKGQEEEFRPTIAASNNTETAVHPIFNKTLDQIRANLKLSIEISSKLSKILLDADGLVPDLQSLSRESKQFNDFKDTKSGENDVSRRALLTLFTTLDENNIQRALIYNNTFRNWASFRPMVQPVMFTNNEMLKHQLQNRGWQILPLQRTGPGGMPVLKYLYLAAMDSFKSDFYSFANSDILFDEGLIKTLVTAKYSYDLTTQMLITGTRYNVPNITDLEVKDRSNLIKIAKERGELFLPWAADYFITTKFFPWMDIPEVIIGSLAYDNWLILYAREKKFLVIDATKTVTAVHQTPESGNFESHSKKHALSNYGILAKTLNKTIDYAKGQVVCTEVVSSIINENVIFEKRAESVMFSLELERIQQGTSIWLHRYF